MKVHTKNWSVYIFYFFKDFIEIKNAKESSILIIKIIVLKISRTKNRSKNLENEEMSQRKDLKDPKQLLMESNTDALLS